MYREQNYIFSFTFVYKSKTACLIKHLFKKKKRKKKKKKVVCCGRSSLRT